MWGIVILVVLLYLFRGALRICVEVVRPIFDFVYLFLIDSLKKKGLSTEAAKALVSLVFVIIVLVVLFS